MFASGFSHGRWFSPGTPVSSTTKNGHHDIAEILLKVTLYQNQIKSLSNNGSYKDVVLCCPNTLSLHLSLNIFNTFKLYYQKVTQGHYVEQIVTLNQNLNLLIDSLSSRYKSLQILPLYRE